MEDNQQLNFEEGLSNSTPNASNGDETTSESRVEPVHCPPKAKEGDNLSGKKCKGFCFFFIAVFLTTVIMVVMNICLFKQTKRAQETIISKFDLISSTDTSLLYSNDSFVGFVESLEIPALEKASLTLIGDVLIQDITRSVEANAVKDGRVQALLIETRSAIEVESSRIRQEYESMQIWYTLLTVVFLVFSFFSLYKTDELVEKCEKEEKRIRDTEEAIQKEMRMIRKDMQEAKDRAEMDITKYKKDAQSELFRANKDVMKSLGDKISSFEADLKAKKEELDKWEKIIESINNSMLTIDNK